jgi:hypothetical protein
MQLCQHPFTHRHLISRLGSNHLLPPLTLCLSSTLILQYSLSFTHSFLSDLPVSHFHRNHLTADMPLRPKSVLAPSFTPGSPLSPTSASQLLRYQPISPKYPEFAPPSYEPTPSSHSSISVSPSHLSKHRGSGVRIDLLYDLHLSTLTYFRNSFSLTIRTRSKTQTMSAQSHIVDLHIAYPPR